MAQNYITDREYVAWGLVIVLTGAVIWLML